MAKQYKTNDLTVGVPFMVQGNITYSRIRSQIAGEELQRVNAQRATRGWTTIDVPHTTITICNAKVLMKNPASPTVEELYAQERLFTSNSEAAKQHGGGMSYTAINKGKFLPRVGVQETGKVVEITPEGELATGLNVTLVFRAYAGKMNNGVSLDLVIVNEPIRYVGPSTDYIVNELSNMGIVFVPSGHPQEMAQPKAPVQVPMAPIQNPYASNPYQQQAAPMNPYQTMQQPIPPIPQGNPFQSFQTAPAPQNAPQAAPTGTQGIMYDPATGGRNY